MAVTAGLKTFHMQYFYIIDKAKFCTRTHCNRSISVNNKANATCHLVTIAGATILVPYHTCQISTIRRSDSNMWNLEVHDIQMIGYQLIVSGNCHQDGMFHTGNIRLILANSRLSSKIYSLVWIWKKISRGDITTTLPLCTGAETTPVWFFRRTGEW